MVMGRIFPARNTINLFRPGPNPARPEKCSPLIVVGFPAVQYQMLLQTICVRVVSVCVVPCHSEKKMMLQSMTPIWFVNSTRGWCGVKKKNRLYHYHPACLEKVTQQNGPFDE
jgi:hypothetical protein